MSYDFSYDGSSGPQNELHELKLYRFHPRKNCWKHVAIGREIDQRSLHHDIVIITWNVDFQAGMVVDRITGALDYLQHNVLKGNAPPPCIIMLQEVHSKALPVIRSNQWVQKHFCLTPIDNLKWPEPNVYGNITLIERSVSVRGAGILYFAQTNMARTALATDIRLAPLEPELYQGKRDLIIRVVNTHLESLKENDGAEVRAEQLALCVELLKEDRTVYGGVIGGDFNAIDEDSTEQVRQHGLSDPGEPAGSADEKQFHTWGFHETKPLGYPTGRLDKIVFTPVGEFAMQAPVIFGQDAKTEEDWVSDHFGLLNHLAV